ncbi:MAG: hypothetical protein J7647_05605 [Cyanobacteria bacterium SBLK]|nr:hypothetical protein [Cyanobacteria bacterium SBLK]
MNKRQTQTKRQTPMQKQFAADCEAKRKECFLGVARELTGRAKQRELSAKDKSLDWEKFNAYFEKAYADYDSEEMLEEILNNVYWLADEQAVIDLRFRYLRDAQEAANGKRHHDDDADEFALAK